MGSDGNSDDGERHDGSTHDGRPSDSSPQPNTDHATDADGDVTTPRTSAAARLDRPGAILPGRTVGQSFTKALAVGALLGSGIGLVSGLVLGATEMGGGGAIFTLMVGLAGALIGVFVGLACGCGAALAVLAAVWLGATGRSVKSVAGAVGAVLSVLSVAAIVEGNGRPILTGGLAFGAAGAFLMLAAAAAAALSISVLDSEPRRAAAVSTARAPQSSTTAQASPATTASTAASTGVAGDPGPDLRRGPPPIPQRPSRDNAGVPEPIAGQGLGSNDPIVVAPDAGHGERTRSLNRARHLRSVAVVLGVLGLISVPWMLLVLGSVFGGAIEQFPERVAAWYVAQSFVAAAIPAGALGFAVASSIAGRRARQAGASDVDLTPTSGGVAVLTGCILAVTLLCGMALLGAVSESRDAAAEQQSWHNLDGPPDYQEQQQSLPQPAEVVPDESATQLSVIEVEAGMQTLLDVAVAAAGPSAVWTISNGDGTSSALSETPADAPAIVTVETSANNAGMSYIYPDVSFTTGVITDTSSDEHDREITDGNVAAAERIVAAWEALGYNEDSGLGGNIDLAGGVDLPATSLHVRYSFGLVTLVRVGQCLPVG
ncbi:hypothetical protein AB4Y63_07940 [Leifsonia sp. YAF41]|uniref:hypothetical protein n=1 Tax=Leifsonia sp. YAF41 TaxID=3233086 RepID=UPI003F995343